MKVIVLGGAGDMGSRAVEDLVSSAGVGAVTVADRNVPAAQALAERWEGRGVEVRARGVDATDHGALVEALRGHDVVASALGPFHRFEARLVRAAIDAQADYASICDEWEPAEAVLSELGAPARASGRTILTGIGASPGLTNLAIRHLAGQMDRVRRADVSVFQPLNAGGGEAVLSHMLFVVTGEVAVWRQGRRRAVPACTESRVVEFPRFGRVRVWNMGHSEPVTVPRFISGIEEVNFFMGFGRGARFFVWPGRWGWFGRPRVVEAIVPALRLMERLWAGRSPAPGALRIDVWGQQGGSAVHRMLCGVGEMREVTGIALSIGAQMVGRKELLTSEGGVFAPEACLDPVTFLRRLDERGVQAYEDCAMSVPLRL